MPVLGNALVESFVLHVRVLIEFLYSGTPRSDDGIAADLVRDQAEWLKARGNLTPLLKEVKRRADKEIAHMTLARLGLHEAARDWGIRKVHAEISTPLALFIEQVPVERVGDGWHEAMRACLAVGPMDLHPVADATVSVPTTGFGPLSGA
jgi:hypothetical protein